MIYKSNQLSAFYLSQDSYLGTLPGCLFSYLQSKPLHMKTLFMPLFAFLCPVLDDTLRPHLTCLL